MVKIMSIVEYRKLDENDIIQLVKYFKEIDLDDKTLYYVNQSLTKEFFSQLSLRDNFFNYSMFAYGMFEDRCLKDTVIFGLPYPIFRQKSCNLLFFSKQSVDVNLPLLKKAIHTMFEICDDMVKVKVFNNWESNNVNNYDFLLNLYFTKELEFEFKSGRGYSLYSLLM